MNEDIKSQWIARLNHPAARQGKGALTTSEGDCCLGVLCKMAVEAGVINAPIISDDGVAYYGVETQVLPFPVVEWAGLDEHNPGVSSPVDYQESQGSNIYEGHTTSLASLNDNALDFPAIAKVIEEQL